MRKDSVIRIKSIKIVQTAHFITRPTRRTKDRFWGGFGGSTSGALSSSGWELCVVIFDIYRFKLLRNGLTFKELGIFKISKNT